MIDPTLFKLLDPDISDEHAERRAEQFARFMEGTSTRQLKLVNAVLTDANIERGSELMKKMKEVLPKGRITDYLAMLMNVTLDVVVSVPADDRFLVISDFTEAMNRLAGLVYFEYEANNNDASNGADNEVG